MNQQALAPTDFDRKLALIERGKYALAEAKNVPEIKHIRDVAASVELYQKQRDASIEAQNDASELRLRAERRLGEVLAEQVKPGRPEKMSTAGTFTPPVTLPDLGISRNQSSRWQQEAAIPEPVFEQYVEETRQADEPLTTRGLLKKAAKTQAVEDDALIEKALATQPVHAEAIRLAELARRWAHVHVWLREHLLPISPALVAEAVPSSQAFLDEQLAFEVAEWFEQLRAARATSPRLVSVNGGRKQ